MLNQKAMTALLSLALAGSMAVPAFAADTGSAQPLAREAGRIPRTCPSPPTGS